MDNQELSTKLKNLLSEVTGIEREAINDDSLLSDLGIDSLDIVEFVLVLEDEFEVEIIDEDLENNFHGKFGDVVKYMAGRLDSK